MTYHWLKVRDRYQILVSDGLRTLSIRGDAFDRVFGRVPGLQVSDGLGAFVFQRPEAFGAVELDANPAGGDQPCKP